MKQQVDLQRVKQVCAEEPGTSEEQVAAAEAFDTALAAGASPEQAMAEAAEVAGLEDRRLLQLNRIILIFIKPNVGKC